MIIELHLIQSFPASNLNRDDLGQPKSVTFGGALRGRVSSQSLKKAARSLFPHVGLAEGETAWRTKRLVQQAAAELEEGDEEQRVAVVTEALRQMGFGVESTGLTEYLLFVGRRAVDDLVAFCRENQDWLLKEDAKRADKIAKAKTDQAKKKLKKEEKPPKKAAQAAKRILDARRAVDIALFGRMIADNKDFNVDAASQVAHAISTHAVAGEFDFYTAVDDLKPDDEAGADMIGTVDFNAACYYRYANLDLGQLQHNLFGKAAKPEDIDEDLLQRATSAWLNAFVRAVPSGKQNSMAARTMPDTLLAVVRDSGSWNLANAFLDPVPGKGVMGASTELMWKHFQQLRGFYGEEEIRAVAMASLSGDLEKLEVPESEQAASLQAFTSKVLGEARG
ncbi:type I-E CRISPR-associated protein Cas7/Cse4/CasC [Nocardiopsis sp. HNM0947]|uniref:Type I-E CRISPR-associated protein Cas7/Cse4/CasC n=1 Tax=Nocardiopsis coralli TaxID=2772213 RepID=A0ABR9P467_9ACTN|nr:type I-E CRISPR-associated protein Cas7/Cse4/CasC [Nocardiopsis coralli]MBE2998645.1 type I-E CRISPR-associated protein Cas7/Cse4/CasC [Nocardiopsis coralli]